MKYVDPSGYETVYISNEGRNDKGEYWYSVYRDKDRKDLVAIVTGCDNLAAMWGQYTWDMENDYAAYDDQQGTQAVKNAKDDAIKHGLGVEWEFFGGNDFGLAFAVPINKSNSTATKILQALAMGFTFWVQFEEAGGDYGGGDGVDFLLKQSTPMKDVQSGEQYSISGTTVEEIMAPFEANGTPLKDSPGYYRMEDGTIVGWHKSTYTGVPTIDINRPDGTIIKIRVKVTANP